MKPPLLFLCHRIPYPPNKGDKIRSFHLLHHLEQHFDIYLATFVDDPLDWAWIPDVEKFCVGSLFVRLNPLTAKLRSATGLLTGKVLSLPYYHNAEMSSWVKERVSAHDIKHLLVFSSAMAQYAVDPEMGFDRRIIDFVDVDSDKWLQYSQRKPWPMSWLYRREGRLLLDYEKQLTRVFDKALFVSAAEAAHFKELAPAHADRVGFYNNGVNVEYFCPDPGMVNPYPDGGHAVVFTGAMDYWPNIDAVTWFAKEVLPEVRAIQPSVHFYIVGSSPAKSVKALEQYPGVVVTGRVEDIRPYLQFADVAVAPMLVARGIQNKVLEGMAMARPVIVSGKGLEGIDAEHGNQVFVAETGHDYVRHIAALIEAGDGGMGQRAREWIGRNFSWEANLPEVVDLLKSVHATTDAVTARAC